MVNRMSSAFRLTPQGSRSTPPPPVMIPSMDYQQQPSNDNGTEGTQILHQNLSPSFNLALSSPVSPIHFAQGNSELAAIAVADGIANGIADSSFSTTSTSAFDSSVTNKTTRVQQQSALDEVLMFTHNIEFCLQLQCFKTMTLCFFLHVHLLYSYLLALYLLAHT